MVVVDDEVDEIDYNNDLVDQDELVQTLIIKIKIFILFKKTNNILEGHKGGRLSNPWPDIGVEGVGNGKPDGWDPVGVAPGLVEGCSGNCGRFRSYK